MFSFKNVQHTKDIFNSFYPVICLDSSEILNQRECQTSVSLCRADELLGEGAVRREGPLAGRKFHGIRKLFCWECQNAWFITFLNSPRGNHSWIWDVYVNFLLRLRRISTPDTWIIKQSGYSIFLKKSEGTNNVWSMKPYWVLTEEKVMPKGGGKGDERRGGNKDQVIQIQPYFSASLPLGRESTSH